MAKFKNIDRSVFAELNSKVGENARNFMAAPKNGALIVND